MNVQPTKTNHLHQQSNVFREWIRKAHDGYGQPNPDHLILFSSLYSGLNGVAWLYTDSTRDKKTITDFAELFYGHHSTAGTGASFNSLITHAEGLIADCKYEFGDVHSMQSRTNHQDGDVVKFSSANTPKKPLSSINLQNESLKSKFLISIELIYHFRCNLVHGAKNINHQANIDFSKKFSKHLLHLFALCPDEVIPVGEKQSSETLANILR